MQAAHEPSQGEVARWDFVVQALQHDRGWDKRSRAGGRCRLQLEPPDFLLGENKVSPTVEQCEAMTPQPCSMGSEGLRNPLLSWCEGPHNCRLNCVPQPNFAILHVHYFVCLPPDILLDSPLIVEQAAPVVRSPFQRIA